LGAARIVPLLSERVVTEIGDKDAAQRAGKWQLVAIEPSSQWRVGLAAIVEAALTP